MSYGHYHRPVSAFQREGSAHWFGTDELGRDSRMLYGGRVTLGAAFGATALSMVLGIAWERALSACLSSTRS
jgi:ABC-type dipeptide/oligopeptide/nickel transport system permease subunit